MSAGVVDFCQHKPGARVPVESNRASVLVVAGEASADRYAARVVERLKEAAGSRSLRFVGTGGERMRAAGIELLADIRDLANIGPHEALAHLRKYIATYRALGREIEGRRPVVALLLDFPEFNLRLAKRLKRAGVPVVYYISPQLWAWRRYRVRRVRTCVDRMLVILPFEVDFYRRHGVAADFVGHPLLEDFRPTYDRQRFLGALGLDPARTTVALLPGSRRGEVDHILPVLLGASVEMLAARPAQFLVSVAPTIDPEYVRRIVSRFPESARPHLHVLTADSRDILANSDFAMVKSGTSTLEAALVGTPFLTTYRISPVSWYIGRILVRSRYKGLVNLIADESIVPELMQGEATPESLARTTLGLLENPEKLALMREQMGRIKQKLSRRCASETVAAVIGGYIGG
jgi:lipid-A-disaccharide synthase